MKDLERRAISYILEIDDETYRKYFQSTEWFMEPTEKIVNFYNKHSFMIKNEERLKKLERVVKWKKKK